LARGDFRLGCPSRSDWLLLASDEEAPLIVVTNRASLG
jgi:hypothetical protein